MVKHSQDLLLSCKRLNEDAVILELWVRDLNSNELGSTHVGRSKDIGHAPARSKILDAVVVEHFATRTGMMASVRWNR